LVFQWVIDLWGLAYELQALVAKPTAVLRKEEMAGKRAKGFRKAEGI
jgi:hypothetical protein